MRHIGTNGSENESHRNDHEKCRKVHRAEGPRQARRVNRHKQPSQSRGHSDGQPKARRRCDRPVNGYAVQGHKRHTKRAATDPKQYRQPAQKRRGHNAPQAGGQGGANAPRLPAKCQIQPNNRPQTPENQLQDLRLQIGCQGHAKKRFHSDTRCPLAQDQPIHCAFFVVTLHGADGGHNNGRQRGRQTDLHELRTVISEGLKGIKKCWHQHDTTAHAQQPCQKFSEAADCDQTCKHR